jgi:hypothetical protein
MSRSRKVCRKPSSQRSAAASLSARKDRGNAPRSQRRSCASAPTSSSDKPGTATNCTRPASVSDAPRTSSGAALPNSRKVARRFATSHSGRRVSNNEGRRCTSSMTTSPWQSFTVNSGVRARAARPAARSRSKTVAGPTRSATWPASVVLPTWRAPSNVTTGDSRRRKTTASSNAFLSIKGCISALYVTLCNNVNKHPPKDASCCWISGTGVKGHSPMAAPRRSPRVHGNPCQWRLPVLLVRGPDPTRSALRRSPCVC